MFSLGNRGKETEKKKPKGADRTVREAKVTGEAHEGIKCSVNLMEGKGQGNKVGKYSLDTGREFTAGIGNMVRK